MVEKGTIISGNRELTVSLVRVYSYCEIVWIYLVFCVLYVNQSLLIAEIYQHDMVTTSTTNKDHSFMSPYLCIYPRC